MSVVLSCGSKVGLMYTSSLLQPSPLRESGSLMYRSCSLDSSITSKVHHLFTVHSIITSVNEQLNTSYCSSKSSQIKAHTFLLTMLPSIETRNGKVFSYFSRYFDRELELSSLSCTESECLFHLVELLTEN